MITAACVVIENDLQYIYEWVEHYQSLGFDKIYIYNRSSDLSNGPYNVFIENINKSLNDKTDLYFYEKCYKEHNTEFDWCGFFNINLFLQLNQHNNIHEYLSDAKIIHNTNINQIQISILPFDSNGEYCNDERYTVKSRFNHISKNFIFDDKEHLYNKRNECYFLIKNDIENISFNENYVFGNNVITIYSNGEYIYDVNETYFIDFTYALVNFYMKSILENLTYLVKNYRNFLPIYNLVKTNDKIFEEKIFDYLYTYIKKYDDKFDEVITKMVNYHYILLINLLMR